jgi:signal transduction histidine kinase
LRATEYYRELFAEAPVAACVLRGKDLVYEFVNARWLQLVNRTHLTGMRYLEAFPEGREQGFDELLRGVMATGKPLYFEEMHARFDRAGDGCLVDTYWNASWVPMLGPDGTIDRVLAIANEVTEQVAARRTGGRNELAALRLMEGVGVDRGSTERVATSLAQGIRDPLATALLYLHLVEKQLGSAVDSALSDGIAGSRHELLRVDRLLAYLIEYYRFGEVAVVAGLVDAGTIVRQAAQWTMPGRSGQEIEVTVGEGDLLDWWDAAAIEQIVQTLVSNASRHTEHPIFVSVDRVGRRLRLLVRHAGDWVLGRPASEIFPPALGAVGRSEGWNAGLWLVRKLAEAHGGTAGIEDLGRGGLAFAVTISPLGPVNPRDALH